MEMKILQGITHFLLCVKIIWLVHGGVWMKKKTLQGFTKDSSLRFCIARNFADVVLRIKYIRFDVYDFVSKCLLNVWFQVFFSRFTQSAERATLLKQLFFLPLSYLFLYFTHPTEYWTNRKNQKHLLCIRIRQRISSFCRIDCLTLSNNKYITLVYFMYQPQNKQKIPRNKQIKNETVWQFYDFSLTRIGDTDTKLANTDQWDSLESLHMIIDNMNERNKNKYREC